jgi:hypothetical protein
MSAVDFRVSSFCTGGGCVAVGFDVDLDGDPDSTTVAVRDDKHPDTPTLTFTTAGWAAFLAAVRRGEFQPRSD